VPQVLCKLERDGHVLLGRKIWKKFDGKEFWNFPGGSVKLEEGETPIQAMRRELQEEAYVRATHCRYDGMLRFHWQQENMDHVVHLFSITAWDGEPVIPAHPQEPPEFLELRWFAVSDVPYRAMFAADRHWVPDWIAGRKLRETYTYDCKKDARLIG
jgi:8-oxo-dGTP diphosphatase